MIEPPLASQTKIRNPNPPHVGEFAFKLLFVNKFYGRSLSLSDNGANRGIRSFTYLYVYRVYVYVFRVPMYYMYTGPDLRSRSGLNPISARPDPHLDDFQRVEPANGRTGSRLKIEFLCLR